VSRPRADDRLRRILAVVPWVVGADGPLVTEVCARFGYSSEAELQSDFNLLFMCGVYPYTPDTLIEVDIADNRVWVRYADYFARPLRLTPAEALALVASSAALLGVGGRSGPDGPEAPGDVGGAGDVGPAGAVVGGEGTAVGAAGEVSGAGPLARGLAKLAAALGIDADEVVDVDLGPAPAATLGILRAATAGHRLVEIDYYGYGRDSRTTRVIEPNAVFSAAGQWYTAAYCHLAQAQRLFRVERVEAARLQDATFTPRASGAPDALYEPQPTDPVVVLDLDPGAAWVAEQYPCESVVDIGGGRQRVQLRISGTAWLERLLLRLGPLATIVEGDTGVAERAAQRLLARYGRGMTEQPTAAPGS
jgi:proteasome accessory factor C